MSRRGLPDKRTRACADAENTGSERSRAGYVANLAASVTVGRGGGSRKLKDGYDARNASAKGNNSLTDDERRAIADKAKRLGLR